MCRCSCSAGGMLPRAECSRIVVEPGDVLDDGELELRVGAPHAVGDQLGLEGVDERLGERVVIRVADGADRRQHAGRQSSWV